MAEWAPAVDVQDLIAHSSANVMVTASEASERLAWARRIHEGLPYREGPFVAVYPAGNGQTCAADVDEWFGRSARGTLFIDDVGEFGSDAQARLSSLLSAQSRRANAVPTGDGDGTRVIAGSSRWLQTDLAAGRFDDTLFYRLNVIHIDRIHQDDQEHTR